MYQLEGIIKYYNSWCLAWLPQDLDRYYRAMLPKAWGVCPPMNKPHVSIVRKFERPDLTHWGKHDGESIIVDVYPVIQTDGTYFWLDCFSVHIGLLREELGLTWFIRGFHSYHITIANLKNK